MKKRLKYTIELTDKEYIYLLDLLSQTLKKRDLNLEGKLYQRFGAAESNLFDKKKSEYYEGGLETGKREATEEFEAMIEKQVKELLEMKKAVGISHGACREIDILITELNKLKGELEGLKS